MKMSRFALIACFLGGTVHLAWASDNAYVCSVRVDTGFAKPSETGFPQSHELRIEAKLTTQPYCQGQPAGSVSVSTPALEKVRSRRKVLDHVTTVRNNWQAALSTFQVLEIAAAQGAPLNRAVVIATNIEEQPAKEFAFQATRPASTKAKAKLRPIGKSGNSSNGYVCLANSKYRVNDPNQMLTVAGIQNFEVLLYSEPFCLGKQVARHDYEFGPPLRMHGGSAAKLYQVTANMNASALMHAIYTTFVEAAMAGQHVSLTHTPDGLISSIEITARARDLAKEIETIATPGQ